LGNWQHDRALGLWHFRTGFESKVNLSNLATLGNIAIANIREEIVGAETLVQLIFHRIQ
jgi:hypothetical protein